MHVKVALTALFLALVGLILPATAHTITADDLRQVEDQSTVTLTTIGRSSGKPRTVTIWFVHDDGRVYVQSGKGGDTNWYKNLLHTAQVTLAFDQLMLRGQAHPITDAKEVERLHALFRKKYVAARVRSWFGGGGIGQGKIVRIDSLEAMPEDPPE